MAIQPLMDILSFWTDRLGMSNTITLLLRFALLPRDRTRLKIALGISGTATLLFILMLLLTIG